MTTKNKEILSKTITKISRQKENKNAVIRIHFSDNEEDTVTAYVFKDTNFYLYENYFYITKIEKEEVVITSDIMAFCLRISLITFTFLRNIFQRSMINFFQIIAFWEKII